MNTTTWKMLFTIHERNTDTDILGNICVQERNRIPILNSVLDYPVFFDCLIRSALRSLSLDRELIRSFPPHKTSSDLLFLR